MVAWWLGRVLRTISPMVFTLPKQKEKVRIKITIPIKAALALRVNLNIITYAPMNRYALQPSNKSQ